MIGSGIRARVLLAAVLPLTIAVAATGGLLLARHAGEIEQHHLEVSIALTKQAAMLAELPLATGSSSSARTAADFFERSRDVTGLSLVDRSGSTLETRGNLGAAAIRLLDGKPVNLMIERDRQLIYLVQPVTLSAAPAADIGAEPASRSQQRVGYVALSVSRAQEHAAVAKLWWTGALILTATLAISILLAQWVARSVARPMARLSDALSRVARGELAMRLPESGHGETRRVATDFNRMASALEAARAGLRDEVARATEALARRTHEAEAANLAKSRYLAAASHDLRQPAHALSLYLAAAQRIASRLPESDGQLLRPVLNGMESSAQSLDTLLNAVLDISRIDAGVLKPKPEAIAVQTVFDQVVREFAAAARDSAVKLVARPSKLGVYADPVLIVRICQNLVSNALKFSNRGRVLLSARRRGDDVLIQVWDQGRGIDHADIERIFDEFYQVSPGDRDRARGMGLGLSIVRRLCLMQGGEIAVSSRLGCGSVFSVTLPLTHSTYRFQREVNDQQEGAPGGGLVIVVDDEAVVRDATSAILQTAGYTVVDAADLAGIEEKLPIGTGPRPRAALVDYRLAAGYTGLEIAQQLRARFGPSLNIVIVTGDTSAERLHALHASGFPVMHKPLSAAQLLAALHSS